MKITNGFVACLILFLGAATYGQSNIYLPPDFSYNETVLEVPVHNKNLKDEVQSNVQRRFGLTTVTFATKYGNIFIYLPDDIRAGDTLSGRVGRVAIGKNDSEKKKNLSKLNDEFFISLGSFTFPKDLQLMRVNLSCGEPVSDVDVTVEQVPGDGNPTGTPLSSDPAPQRPHPDIMKYPDPTEWPCLDRGPGGEPLPIRARFPFYVINKGRKKILSTAFVDVRQRSTLLVPGDYSNPTTTPANRPSYIQGSMDGDFATSDVIVEMEKADVIVKGPRHLVYVFPKALKHLRNQLNLKTNSDTGKTLSGTTNVTEIIVKISKEKPKIGEAVDLTVEVRGLDGLEVPLDLTVVNRSPGSARFHKGDENQVKILPGMADASGTYTYTDKVTAVGPGLISTLATVKHDTVKNAIQNMK